MTVVIPQCEDGWSVLGDSCFKAYMDRKKNFNGAGKFCAKQGGYVAKITSPEAQELVKSLTNRK